MLSHDNLIFKAKLTEITLQMKNNNRRVLLYLPLSHVASQVCVFLLVLNIKADTNILPLTSHTPLRLCIVSLHDSLQLGKYMSRIFD